MIVSHAFLFIHTISALIKHSNFSQSVLSCQPQKAIAKIRESKPTTIIFEIPCSDFSILNLLHKIHKQYRHIKIIVITDNLAPAFLIHLFKIKISGCISKYCSLNEFQQALSHKNDKKIFYDETIFNLLPALRDKRLTKINLLTRQEFQIVVMLAHGIKTHEISKQLHLSCKTISSYHTQILNKLNLEHNIEIVQFIYQHDLLLLPMKFSRFVS